MPENYITCQDEKGSINISEDKKTDKVHQSFSTNFCADFWPAGLDKTAGTCYNKLLSEQTHHTGRDTAACVPLALQIRRALKSKRRCYKNGKVRNHADYQRRSR